MSEVLGGWLMGCLPPGRYWISTEWTEVPFSDRPFFNLLGSFLSFRSQVLASWGVFLTTPSNIHTFLFLLFPLFLSFRLSRQLIYLHPLQWSGWRAGT